MVTKNQIILPDISVEYQGFYSCNASNVVGYDEERGHVIIHSKFHSGISKLLNIFVYLSVCLISNLYDV